MLHARPINVRRARKDEMLLAERKKLSRMFAAFMDSREAPACRSGDHGQFFDGYDLETTAGTLRVHPMASFIACRFADVERARTWYYGDREANSCHGRLNPHSGKFNFHFGRVTAAEAFREFTQAIAPILP